MLLRRKTHAAVLGALLSTLATGIAHAEGPWDRNVFDVDDLEALDRRNPGKKEQLLAGEAALRTGDLEKAVQAFAGVVAKAPENALATRRHCQALTLIGKRSEAIAACQSSLQAKLTAPAFRAYVGALMSAPATPDEIVLAIQLAGAARRHMRDQPWGLAALGDVAERTGDEKMLTEVVTELSTIAPDHYETIRARKALDAFRAPRWITNVWLGLGALCGLTALHALGSAWRKRRMAAASLALVAMLLGTGSASADEAPSTPPPGGLSKWHVDDADPVKSLPTTADRDKNPLEFGYHMMDLADKADIAKRKGDFTAVGKYYEAMAHAVPDRAIGYRKSCEGYEKAGNVEKALEMCRGALAIEGSELGDYQRFAKLLFTHQPLTATDIEDLSEVSKHLSAAPATKAAGLQIECDLAERLNAQTRLKGCVEALSVVAPNDPKLVVYRWAIAMNDEDFARARELIEVAKKNALQPAGIALMEQATERQSALGSRALRLLRRNALPLGAGLGTLCAVILAFGLRRRMKLQPASAS